MASVTVKNNQPPALRISSKVRRLSAITVFLHHVVAENHADVGRARTVRLLGQAGCAALPQRRIGHGADGGAAADRGREQCTRQVVLGRLGGVAHALADHLRRQGQIRHGIAVSIFGDRADRVGPGGRLLGVCAAEKTEAAIQIFGLSDRARFNDLDMGKG